MLYAKENGLNMRKTCRALSDQPLDFMIGVRWYLLMEKRFNLYDAFNDGFQFYFRDLRKDELYPISWIYSKIMLRFITHER